jgi:hypothetical protein
VIGVNSFLVVDACGSSECFGLLIDVLSLAIGQCKDMRQPFGIS